LFDYARMRFTVPSMVPTLSQMTDDRKGALAIFAGAAGGMITMFLHPHGLNLAGHGEFEPVASLNVFVHTLALASLPVAFLGALALWRRLDSPSRLALAGLVCYALALIAVASAAAMSGFVATGVGRRVLEASPQEVEVWRVLLRYTGEINQAFARIFVYASSTAILLWSAVIVRERTLARGAGVYGYVLGPILILAVGSGHLRLGVHGFGIVVLTESIWFVSAGILLWRLAAATAHEGRSGGVTEG
jgi:hypothetical protein